MANSRLTSLSELTANLAVGDVVYVVDVSDTTDNAAGSSFKRKIGTLSLPPTEQTGTTYTIDEDDDGTLVALSNASQVTVTIPTDASDDLRDGYSVMLLSTGAGGVTLSTTGITLSPSTANTTIQRGEVMTLVKTTSANTWHVIGGTS